MAVHNQCRKTVLYRLNPTGTALPACVESPNCPYAVNGVPISNRATYGDYLQTMDAVYHGIMRQPGVSGWHPTDAQPAVTRWFLCMTPPWLKYQSWRNNPPLLARPLDRDSPVPLINDATPPFVIRWSSCAGKREFTN